MIDKYFLSMIHVTRDSLLSPRHIVHMLLSTPNGARCGNKVDQGGESLCQQCNFHLANLQPVIHPLPRGGVSFWTRLALFNISPIWSSRCFVWTTFAVCEWEPPYPKDRETWEISAQHKHRMGSLLPTAQGKSLNLQSCIFMTRKMKWRIGLACWTTRGSVGDYTGT